MGEIDDIFAGKTRSKGKAKEVEEPTSTPVVSKKKKKKSKKADTKEPPAPAPAPAPESSQSSGTKRKVPETVLDPSLSSEPKKKKSKGEKKGKAAAARAENSDDERFKDSRGTGPRRRTEEGYAIYKEDELKIGLEGGGKLGSVSRVSMQLNELQTQLCVLSTVIAAFESTLCFTTPPPAVKFLTKIA